MRMLLTMTAQNFLTPAGQIVFNISGAAGSGVAGGASRSSGITTATTGASTGASAMTGTTTTKTDCVTCQQVGHAAQCSNLDL